MEEEKDEFVEGLEQEQVSQAAEPEPTPEELRELDADHEWHAPLPGGKRKTWVGPRGGEEWKKWKGFIQRHAFAQVPLQPVQRNVGAENEQGKR